MDKKIQYKYIITEYIDNDEIGSVVAICDTEEGANIKVKEFEDKFKDVILPDIPYNDWDKAESIMYDRYGNCLNIDAYCQKYCEEFADVLKTFGCDVAPDEVKVYWEYTDYAYKINHVTYITSKVEYFQV